MSPDCTHGGALKCVFCRTGFDDLVEAYVADAKLNLADEEEAAIVAEALIREQGMEYLDGLSPEEAARLAVAALREHGKLPDPDAPYGCIAALGEDET